MKTVAIEDLATEFVTEFVRMNKRALQGDDCRDHRSGGWKPWSSNIPFLKMSYARRRKLIEKTLDKIEKQ